VKQTQKAGSGHAVPSAVRTVLMKVGTTFYRRMILVERDLVPLPAVPDLSLPIEIGPLRFPEDSAALASFRPEQSSVSTLSRVEKGNLCFAVWHEGKIVHAGWVAVRRTWVEYLNRDLLLGERDIFIFDSFTLQGYRRRHLANARSAVVSDYFSERGFRRSLGLVAVENKPGLAVPDSLGYRRIGLYASLGVGRWSRAWSRPLLGGEIPQLVRCR